jgi:gluconokinase
VIARVVILMGVTGSGKSTVARALADRLDWPFCDADDLHSPENIERMRQGISLDDRLREPWLIRIRQTIESALARQESIVVACSALKERYRVVLADGLEAVRFVHLTAPEAVLRDRLQHRPDHFAGTSLLDSQLASLEPPVDALTLDATLPVQQLVDLIREDLSRPASDCE